METFKQLFISYSTAFDILPEDVRLIAAIVVVVILVTLFLRFIQKSLVWLVIFILLIPAAWPAICEIGIAIWEKVIVPFMQ